MNPIRCFSAILVFFSFSILLAQDPPANNTYQTATTLTVQDGSCTSQTEGDLTYASSSNNPNYLSQDCFYGYDYVTEYAAVWYKVIVPSSGEFTIETSAVPDSSSVSDTVMVAYTLSEDVLTEIDCDDDGSGLGNFSKIELSGQTENTEIYVMVVEFSDVNYGDDSRLGTFNICVFDPSTLETPLIKSPLLSYYSNPVGNRLSVESPYEIQSLSVYDLAGRELLTKNPQQQKLTIDTYSLSPGVYMLNVKTELGQQTVKLVKN